MTDFATTYLKYLGYPVTPGNVSFLRAFATKEGGHVHNDASYNWLNTTRGSQYPSINSVGVRAYPNLQTGLAMTRDTMQNYPTIMKMLAAGQGNKIISLPGGQADLNMWLTGKRTPGVSQYVSSIASLMGQDLPPGGMGAPDGGNTGGPAPDPAADMVRQRHVMRAGLGQLLASTQETDPRQQARAMLGALLTPMRRVASVAQTPSPAPLSSGSPAPGAAAPVSPGGVGGVRELFYDPLGAYDEGKWINPIGGHSDHVHVSFGNPQSAMQIIALAKQMGLRASENPWAEGSAAEQGVHTKTSYHYQNFPGSFKGGLSPTLGRALDVSGDPAKMAAFYKAVRRSYLGGKR